MDYNSLEIRVGVAIFIAAVALTIGLLWFQGFKAARSEYEIYAIFPMVGGVSPGDKVNVNGVERGEVKRVELREKDVLVTLRIRTGTKIPEDSKIVLQTVGIMGDRQATILLGSSEKMLAPGAVIKGIYDPGISEALAFLGAIMDELTVLTRDMQNLASALTRDGKLSRSVENLAVISEELRSILESDRHEIRAGLHSFRRAAETMDRLLTRNESSLDTILSSLGEASKDMPELVRRVGILTDSLSAIAAKVQSGEGAIGVLLNDRTLIDSLDRTVKELGALVADIKANPKKYVKISVF